MIARPGQAVVLTVTLPNRATDKFLRALVFDETGNTAIATIDLDHVVDGLYRGSAPFVVPSAQKFVVIYSSYDDAARTILSPEFEPNLASEDIEARSVTVFGSAIPPRT